LLEPNARGGATDFIGNALCGGLVVGLIVDVLRALACIKQYIGTSVTPWLGLGAARPPSRQTEQATGSAQVARLAFRDSGASMPTIATPFLALTLAVRLAGARTWLRYDFNISH